jgi:hypothetical protein
MVPHLKCDFAPFTAYRRFETEVNEFVNLTALSYGLAQQLLFKTPRQSLRDFLPSPAFTDLSFSMADQEVGAVERTCSWLSLAKYAEKMG